jgi:oxygen-independent coproporphyrinogen-3 oxidase
MMGLRLKEGLDLNNKTYKSAYDFFGDKIKKYTMIKNNHLSAKNINLIDNILLEII